MNKTKQKEKNRIIFTKEMRREYTILIPMMAPIHFELIKNVLRNYGYKAELLENRGPSVVQEGLKYVHNDTCYPALLVIGQMIDALGSGRYDLARTAVMITQTGGGCRASNYIYLLRKALSKAGLSDIPVVSLNPVGIEKNPGFKLTLSMLRKMMAALFYGDALMLLSNQVRPYEIEKGETDRLVRDTVASLSGQLNRNKGYSLKEFWHNIDKIAEDFARIETERVSKVKVGVVGEIYVKYSALGNNGLEEFLAGQDCEIMVPGMMAFIRYCAFNMIEDIRRYGGNPIKLAILRMFMGYLKRLEQILSDAVGRYPAFVVPTTFDRTCELARGVIDSGCKMGEGWLLTAEMMELLDEGYENIICTQPFGCLPNHICGKGMIRKIKGIHDNANIVPIDYDPSATRVNQENRIKLMLAVARENLAAEGQAPQTQEKHGRIIAESEKAKEAVSF